MCSWWCSYGATFLLFWRIPVACHLTGGLLLMKREGRLTPWLGRILVVCRLTHLIKESGIAGSATSWNHLVAIIAQFVSHNMWSFFIISFSNILFCFTLLCSYVFKSELDVGRFFVSTFRWAVCTENGSPLCLGCKLCWGLKLQVFSTFLGKFVSLRKVKYFSQEIMYEWVDMVLSTEDSIFIFFYYA